MTRCVAIAALVALTGPAGFAQSPAERYLAYGKAMWDQRLAKSAIASLDLAAKDPSTAAEAHD